MVNRHENQKQVHMYAEKEKHVRVVDTYLKQLLKQILAYGISHIIWNFKSDSEDDSDTKTNTNAESIRVLKQKKS
jgi:hypothetical protein